MAGNLIRGSTQIMPQTVTQGLLDPAIAIPDNYLLNGANFIKKDGTVPMAANLNMAGYKITGLATGVNPTDAVAVSQLQSLASGQHLHFARFVIDSNIASKSGLGTYDTVAPNDGDVGFLIGQTTLSENGPWVLHSGAWTRPPDWANASVQTEGHYWIIEPDGNTYKNTKWFLANVANVTVDTSNVTFIQDKGMIYANGSGLSLTGNIFAVARGNGIGLDGSNNLTVTIDNARLLQVLAGGIGIKDGTAAQLLMANSAGNASYQTLSGDAAIDATGVFSIVRSAAAGFMKYADAVLNETPSGTLNGTNTVFSLASTPKTGVILLFKNGLLQVPGSGNQYTISGTALTMATAPLASDNLTACYFK